MNLWLCDISFKMKQNKMNPSIKNSLQINFLLIKVILMKWQRLPRVVKQSTQSRPDAPHTVWEVPNFVQEGRGNGGSWRSLVSACGKTLCSWRKRMLLIFKAKHISDPFDILRQILLPEDGAFTFWFTRLISCLETEKHQRREHLVLPFNFHLEAPSCFISLV